MKSFPSGARQYVWCRSQAVWLNLTLTVRLEDLEGAVAAGQPGLVRYSAIEIGETCAQILALWESNERPLPARKMRSAWAFARIDGHALAGDCLELVRSFGPQVADAEIREKCLALVAAVRDLVGEVPDALKTDGYYPAIAVARAWHEMRDALGEQSFLPEEWSRRPATAGQS